jgi:hypothetical protein
MTPTKNFTTEKEIDNKINFSDITIQKEKDNLSFNIYRKPTTTDIIIPGDSCHPQEQKHTAIKYLINRMNTYSLSDDNKEVENNTIKHILPINNYDVFFLKLRSKTEHKVKHNKSKWAKFSCVGKETKFVTKLFKDSSIRVTFTTNDTISKSLSLKQNHPQKQNQFEKSGVYQLACPECSMRYSGQTGRPFRVRFQEHFLDYKYANNKSKFALHLLENKHSIGHIDDIMKVLCTTNKGKLMDTIERFYIYKETSNNNQINGRNTVKPNIIFDIIVR